MMKTPDERTHWLRAVKQPAKGIVPVTYVGFLWAAYWDSFLLNAGLKHPVECSRMVLFAPALIPIPFAKRSADFFKRWIPGQVVPNPREYSVNALGLPCDGWSVLLEDMSLLEVEGYSRSGRVPTFAFIESQDEVVNRAEVQKLMDSGVLPWNFRVVDGRPRTFPLINRQLIIDVKTLGGEA